MSWGKPSNQQMLGPMSRRLDVASLKDLASSVARGLNLLKAVHLLIILLHNKEARCVGIGEKIKLGIR